LWHLKRQAKPACPTLLYNAVVAPIPSAIVSTATLAKPGAPRGPQRETKISQHVHRPGPCYAVNHWPLSSLFVLTTQAGDESILFRRMGLT